MNNKSVAIQVKSDYLQKISRSSPVAALAELIWNALDADATTISIETIQNELGQLSEIIVKDDGHGIPYDHAEHLFSSLGGSWKAEHTHTANGKRFLHGQEGKGRFKAFALGRVVEWQVGYEHDGRVFSYDIEGFLDNLETFQLKGEGVSDRQAPGVTVRISELEKDFPQLQGELLRQQLSSIFSIYLTMYQNVSILINDDILTPAEFVADRTSYDLKPVHTATGVKNYEVEIIEWSVGSGIEIYFCNAYGFPLEKCYRTISAGKGKSYTVFIKSDHLNQLNNEGLLAIADMNEGVTTMLDDTINLVQQHFRSIEQKDKKNSIESWKNSGVYPYPDEAVGADEKRERQIYDSFATALVEAVPDLEKASAKVQNSQLKMLQYMVRYAREPLKTMFASDMKLSSDTKKVLKKL